MQKIIRTPFRLSLCILFLVAMIFIFNLDSQPSKEILISSIFSVAFFGLWSMRYDMDEACENDLQWERKQYEISESRKHELAKIEAENK